MSICADKWIIEKCRTEKMIEPFEEDQVRSVDGKKIISYGVSSYGYDIRVSNQFQIFTNVYGSIVDPKQFDTKSLVKMEGDFCIIPPNSFVLAMTMEYFRIRKMC